MQDFNLLLQVPGKRPHLGSETEIYSLNCGPNTDDLTEIKPVKNISGDNTQRTQPKATATQGQKTNSESARFDPSNIPNFNNYKADSGFCTYSISDRLDTHGLHGNLQNLNMDTSRELRGEL
jgi:hypothetical protein